MKGKFGILVFFLLFSGELFPGDMLFYITADVSGRKGVTPDEGMSFAAAVALFQGIAILLSEEATVIFDKRVFFGSGGKDKEWKPYGKLKTEGKKRSFIGRGERYPEWFGIKKSEKKKRRKRKNLSGALGLRKEELVPLPSAIAEMQFRGGEKNVEKLMRLVGAGVPLQYCDVVFWPFLNMLPYTETEQWKKFLGTKSASKPGQRKQLPPVVEFSQKFPGLSLAFYTLINAVYDSRFKLVDMENYLLVIPREKIGSDRKLSVSAGNITAAVWQAESVVEKLTGSKPRYHCLISGWYPEEILEDIIPGSESSWFTHFLLILDPRHKFVTESDLEKGKNLVKKIERKRAGKGFTLEVVEPEPSFVARSTSFWTERENSREKLVQKGQNEAKQEVNAEFYTEKWVTALWTREAIFELCSRSLDSGRLPETTQDLFRAPEIADSIKTLLHHGGNIGTAGAIGIRKYVARAAGQEWRALGGALSMEGQLSETAVSWYNDVSGRLERGKQRWIGIFPGRFWKEIAKENTKIKKWIGKIKDSKELESFGGLLSRSWWEEFTAKSYNKLNVGAEKVNFFGHLNRMITGEFFGFGKAEEREKQLEERHKKKAKLPFGKIKVSVPQGVLPDTPITYALKIWPGNQPAEVNKEGMDLLVWAKFPLSEDGKLKVVRRGAEGGKAELAKYTVVTPPRTMAPVTIFVGVDKFSDITLEAETSTSGGNEKWKKVLDELTPIVKAGLMAQWVFPTADSEGKIKIGSELLQKENPEKEILVRIFGIESAGELLENRKLLPAENLDSFGEVEIGNLDSAMQVKNNLSPWYEKSAYPFTFVDKNGREYAGALTVAELEIQGVEKGGERRKILFPVILSEKSVIEKMKTSVRWFGVISGTAYVHVAVKFKDKSFSERQFSRAVQSDAGIIGAARRYVATGIDVAEKRLSKLGIKEEKIRLFERKRSELEREKEISKVENIAVTVGEQYSQNVKILSQDVFRGIDTEGIEVEFLREVVSEIKEAVRKEEHLELEIGNLGVLKMLTGVEQNLWKPAQLHLRNNFLKGRLDSYSNFGSLLSSIEKFFKSHAWLTCWGKNSMERRGSVGTSKGTKSIVPRVKNVVSTFALLKYTEAANKIVEAVEKASFEDEKKQVFGSLLCKFCSKQIQKKVPLDDLGAVYLEILAKKKQVPKNAREATDIEGLRNEAFGKMVVEMAEKIDAFKLIQGEYGKAIVLDLMENGGEEARQVAKILSQWKNTAMALAKAEKEPDLSTLGVAAFVSRSMRLGWKREWVASLKEKIKHAAEAKALLRVLEETERFKDAGKKARARKIFKSTCESYSSGGQREELGKNIQRVGRHAGTIKKLFGNDKWPNDVSKIDKFVKFLTSSSHEGKPVYQVVYCKTEFSSKGGIRIKLSDRSEISIEGGEKDFSEAIESIRELWNAYTKVSLSAQILMKMAQDNDLNSCSG